MNDNVLQGKKMFLKIGIVISMFLTSFHVCFMFLFVFRVLCKQVCL